MKLYSFWFITPNSQHVQGLSTTKSKECMFYDPEIVDTGELMLVGSFTARFSFKDRKNKNCTIAS